MVQFSKRWGPQLDRTDGTIGDLKLVKRFVLVRGDGNLLHACQGRYTYEDRETTQGHCDAFLENNPPGSDKHHYVEGLHVAEWWCYPKHFDPVGRVMTEEEIADELRDRGSDPNISE